MAESRTIESPDTNRTPLGHVAFAMMLYVVFDGFSHGMFDVALTPQLSMTALALLASTFLVAGESLASMRSPLRPPWALAGVLVVFVVYLFYSATWSGGTYDLSFPKNLLLFLLISELCTTRRDIAWVLGAAAAAGLFQALLGLVQMSQVMGLPEGGVAGLLPNHVQYAFYLLLSAIALLPFLAVRRGMERIPAAAGMTLMVAVALLSLARGVLVVGVAVAIAAILLLVRSRKRAAAWLGGLFAAGFAATLLSGRFGTLLDIPAALGDTARLDHLLSNRLPLLLAAWAMFVENPLLGVGYGRYPQIWAEYAPEFGNVWMWELELAAHSTYLQLMAVTGLIGITLYVAMLFLGMGYALRAVHAFAAEERQFIFYASVAAFLGILAFALHGTLDNSGWHDRVFYVYLALAAVVWGQALTRNESVA